MKVRVRTRSNRLWFLSLLLVLGLLPVTMRAAEPEEKGTSALTPLVVDPNGYEDPLTTFQKWREQNRVSLPCTPPIWEAHLQWQQLNEPASRSTARETTAGPVTEVVPAAVNICPNSGVEDYQGEVSIAVNPYNPSQLVAGANTFYQDPTAACQAPSGTTYGTQALYGSSDGGTTWIYNCAPWPSNDTGSVGTIMFGSDPAMAWDASGNAYAAYMLISQNSSGTSSSTSIVVARSTDAGATWAPLSVVVNDLNSASSFDDKDMMAIDTTSGQSHSHPGRIYVIWDTNNAERVAYADPPVYAFSTAVPLDGSQLNIGGDLAVGADGTVYAVWNRLIYGRRSETGETTVFSLSTNGGVSWSVPATIATHGLLSFGSNNKPPAQNQRGVNAFASVAVDNCATSAHKGNLYVVYDDFPTGVTSGTDLDTYLVESTNNGGTWTPPAKVNDDAGSATQFFPWVAVDQSTGYVNVSWYDTRNTTKGTNDYRQTQVFFAQSTNGGVSFSPNYLVTAASSQFFNSTLAYSDENSTDNVNYNPNQYGDYSGIAALGGTIHPFWTDSRQFYPANTSSLLKEDAATATVTCLPPTGVTETDTTGGVTLSWTAAPGAGSYNVVRTTGACPSSASPVTFSNVTSPFTDSSGAEGQSYCYTVQAINACGTYSASGVTGMHLTPPWVADGSGGTVPMTGSKTASDGSAIAVTWDTGCGAQQYQIIYGGGSQLPTSYAGTYGVAGGACNIGTTGSATWDNTITPSSDPTNFYWWLVVATDGSATEGSWGHNSGGIERTGPAGGGSSGQCGVTSKSLSNTCSQ